MLFTGREATFVAEGRNQDRGHSQFPYADRPNSPNLNTKFFKIGLERGGFCLSCWTVNLKTTQVIGMQKQ